MQMRTMIGVLLAMLPVTKANAVPLASSACTLVTTAELEKIVGAKIDAKPYLYNFPNGGSSCTYQSGQIQLVLYSGGGADKKYDEYIRSNFAKIVKTGSPDFTRHPVSGVGSSAYFMNPKGASAILVVNKGRHTFAVSMAARPGKTPEAMKPTLISIAKIAASRLGLL